MGRINPASAASAVPARASALQGCTTPVSIGLRVRQRSMSPSSRCSAIWRCCRVVGARTSSIAVATTCPDGSVHWPSITTIPWSGRFSRTTSRAVIATEIGSALMICTEAMRIELPGPGRDELASAVIIEVTMPAAAWLSPGPASMSPSPKAAAQARKSPACRVRSTDAASPVAISSNVLFTTICMAAPSEE